MDTPWVANDDFLWHHHQMMVLSNSYWQDVTAEISPDWRVPQRVPMDIRVSRRLKQREVLVLLMQVSQKPLIGPAGVLQHDTWADLRVCFQPCLRTLVRTIT